MCQKTALDMETCEACVGGGRIQDPRAKWWQFWKWVQCPVCHGEGYVSIELWKKYYGVRRDQVDRLERRIKSLELHYRQCRFEYCRMHCLATQLADIVRALQVDHGILLDRVVRLEHYVDDEKREQVRRTLSKVIKREGGA